MATSAVIASVNPFPNDIRNAFQSFIQSPNYINRERIAYAKWRQLHLFLDDPDLKPQSQTESRLRHRAYTEFELIHKKLYRKADSKFPNPRYVVPESETFDIIANEHLKLLHTGQTKTWAAVQQKYYGIKRQEIEFILKRCKNCALNRPAAAKAPLVPIITGRAWERVQIDLIDMRHEPSGQYKWILHIKDHFSKYTQLYPLKSKHAQPIADAFAQFIAAFLPPKIMQADNGKEFKGALLILLRKYGIQIINGAPRSPQTQGLVEQANGVVETKLRAWKMDHGSTEWADGILEVTLAMNTQIHSTIGCAPAELLFRERTSYVDWLNSHARKDINIGITNEDPTQGPIYTLSPSQLSSSSGGSRIDIGIYTNNSPVTMRISPEASHIDPRLRVTPPFRSSAVNEWINLDTGKPRPISAHQLICKPASQLTKEQERGRDTQHQIEPTSQQETEQETEQETKPTSESASEVASEQNIESTILVRLKDPIIEKAQKATQKARAQMAQKYSKRSDIQHFETGDVVPLKVPREDRTSTDNRRLFGRILEEPHPHRYKVLTYSGTIQRLVPTKGLGAVDEALWSDIIIPDSTKEVTLSLAAREGSMSISSRSFT